MPPVRSVADLMMGWGEVSRMLEFGMLRDAIRGATNTVVTMYSERAIERRVVRGDADMHGLSVGERIVVRRLLAVGAEYVLVCPEADMDLNCCAHQQVFELRDGVRCVSGGSLVGG